MQRVQIGLDQRVPAAELLADQLLDRGHIHVQQRRQHAEIDDVLEQLPLPRVGVVAVADRRQRRADDVDVVAEFRWRQRLRRIVEQIAAGLDLGDVLVPGLRVHRDHHVDAAAPAEMAALADPHLVPGRQTLDVRREDVARARRNAHPQDRLGEQRVGARRARPVDVGEFDDEVVDALDRGRFRVSDCVAIWLRARERRPKPVSRLRHAGPACVMSRRNLRMSQAPVGQRSAHRPQCRQTSSSLTMMRPVFSELPI